MGIVYPKRCLSLLAAAAAVVILTGNLFAADKNVTASAGIDPATGYFTVSYSVDGGHIWSKPYEITKNGSAVKAYKISTAETPPAVAWIESSGSLPKAFYTIAYPGYTVSEIITLSEINGLALAELAPSSPFVVLSGGNQLYVTNSVDNGKNWSSIKTFSIGRSVSSLECIPSAGGLSVITESGSAEMIVIPAPAAPGFASEGDIVTISRDLELPFIPSSGAEDHTVAYLFEISSDKDFLNPVASTIESDAIGFSLPGDFVYGDYYCRIAAWNGLEKTYSDIRTLHFTADNTPRSPEMTLVQPSDTDWIGNSSTVYFEFSAKDPQDDIKDETEATAYLNGTTLEASLVYDKTSGNITGFAKIPGNALNGLNLLRAEVCDAAGNKGSMEAKIKIDSIAPVLGIALKNNTAYANRRDKVLAPLKDDGAGPDLHNSSIKLFYQGTTLEGAQASDDLSGSLIFIPAVNLQKDSYTVEIITRDQAGNRSERIIFALAIDQTVPNISLDPTTSETTVALMTISGTIDEKDLASISIQKNSSPAKVIPLSKGRFSSDIELDRGENTIKITATDLAGNSGTTGSTICLSAPPDIVFFKFDDATVSDGDFVSSTASVKLTDDAGSGISGGTVKIDGTDVVYDETTGAVTASPFSAGSHTVTLTAGTKAYSLSFSVQDTLRINSATSCPNPFDPSSQTAAITYNVSKDSEVTAYIFDTRGSLVWKGNATADIGYNGNLTWDGRSLDGRPLSNGVYIVRLLAKDSTGNVSACSGRIVLLK